MNGFAGNLTALGVRRPVLIAVVNLLIMLAGLAGILGVEIGSEVANDYSAL